MKKPHFNLGKKRTLQQRLKMSATRKLQNNKNWKGGEFTRYDGYILVRKGSFPKSFKGARYKLKHRIVMEEFLNRPLLRSEVIHHKNGNPSDNRIENLEIITQNKHAEIHYYLRQKNEKGQFV